MNTTKISRIAGYTIGAGLWALMPMLGQTTNYAQTAYDELVLLGTGTVSDLVASYIQENSTGNTLIKNMFRGLGGGAFGLLTWNISTTVTSSLKQKLKS